MNLTISPNVGVGPIRFGMTIEQVRAAIPYFPRSLKKTSVSAYPTDIFRDIGVHVFYKAPGLCEAVEMGGVAAPTFQEKTIIRRPFHEVLAWIRSVDPDVQVSNSGLKSFKFGISLYAPGVGEDASEPVQGVMVFERGYYD
jgi:hypothetical protein